MQHNEIIPAFNLKNSSSVRNIESAEFKSAKGKVDASFRSTLAEATYAWSFLYPDPFTRFSEEFAHAIVNSTEPVPNFNHLFAYLYQPKNI